MTELASHVEKGRFSGQIRPLAQADLVQVRPILETYLRDRNTGALNTEEVQEDLDLMRQSCEGGNDRVYLVADDGKQVIGVIGMRTPSEAMQAFTSTERPVELVNAYVAERHQGVGSALVERLEEEALIRYHTEIVLNSGPRYKDSGWGFYDNLPGYGRVGIATKLYGEGGDAPVWRKVLDYNPEDDAEEIESIAEEQEEVRYLKKLTENKLENYTMLRKLKPIASAKSYCAMNFMELYDFSEYYEKMPKFQQWQGVEGGEIQVREDPNPNSEDMHGYAVVRPDNDPEHDIYLRVWSGSLNSVVIMPRSDNPLPHHGKLKEQILEQMKLIESKELDNYTIWLKRMKNV